MIGKQGITAAAVVVFALAASLPPAQAQSSLAIAMIGGAIGGVAGALTEAAIEDARARRYGGPVVRESGPVLGGYTLVDAASSDRSGVMYNKPCSSFDAVSGRLLPCDSPVLVGAAIAVPRDRRATAVIVGVRPVRYAPRYHGAYAYRPIRAPARVAPAFRGVHR